MNVLDDFLRTTCTALGVDIDAVDRNLILDLTKDVAHNVARPAAPLTAFIIGMAAGQAGGDIASVRAAAGKVAEVVAVQGKLSEAPSPTHGSAEGH